MTQPCPAIIPASGRSFRMGEPKALLDAGGQTFLARILTSLRAGGADPLIVVVREMEGPIAEEAQAHGGTVVLNPDPSTGPVSSLQAGIRSLGEEDRGLLFAPVDHPLFSPDTVRMLLEGFNETGAPLIVPAFEGWRGHPVLFSRTLFQELLENYLPEGARTVVRRYLEERVQLEVQDAGILMDIDTPEEYRKHFPREP